MNGESKIKCGCILRHRFNFTLRSKYKYLRCEKIKLDCIQKVKGIGLRIIQNFFDGFQPFAKLSFVFTSSSFFVFPVCSKTLLCYIIHSLTSDLNFNPLSFVAHQCHMKSLISIGFWMADPIAQTVRMRLIYPGNSYINVEAVIQFFLFILRSENDAYGKYVIDFFKRDMFVLHLVPNGVGRLDTCQDTIRKPHFI